MPQTATTQETGASDAAAPSGPRYIPWRDGRFRLAMGLRSLAAPDWFEVDADYREMLELKARLLAERHGEVFAAVAESLDGQREVLRLLLANLAAHHPGLVAADGDGVRVPATGQSYRFADFAAAPLDLAGRLVQEDLCLMAPGPEGYRLVAASLCFPSRWRLAEKLGQPMRAIHAPVPGYAETLGRPVDRFFEHLHADRPVQRLNWSVQDCPDLFQLQGHGRTGENPAITAANAGEMLWIRVERQTIIRLPCTGMILFGVRTHIDPLASLAGHPQAARALAAAIADLPDGMRRYKSVGTFERAAATWLHAAANKA